MFAIVVDSLNFICLEKRVNTFRENRVIIITLSFYATVFSFLIIVSENKHSH